MKNNRKLALTIIGLLCYLSSYAQLNINIANKITLSLPQGTVWYNDSTYRKLLMDRIGSNKPIVNVSKYTYRFNNMVFKFNKIDLSISLDYLKAEKEKLELEFKKETISKNINGNSLLIVMNYGKQSGVYKFYCINEKRTIGFTGTVAFSNSQNDKEYNFNIMDDIFKTIKFVE